jgi:zinc transport system substrate-binding protein
MKRALCLLLLILIVSCGRQNKPAGKIITVSIAPFKYFVEGIAGKNFTVNIMVPAGSNPHVYEPFPEQLNKLRKSAAYISNGYLGFELTWLDRFYEMNRKMKKLSLGDGIDLIMSERHHERENAEGADPHYWESPLCAYKMASSVRDLLIELDPENREQYDFNYNILTEKIKDIDVRARELSTTSNKKAFMIYHPNLGYLARDYGLEEIAVEFEGKEPTPSRLTELIDRAKREKLNVILVQKEYDTKNARAIADEVGARVVIIDPLSEDWYSSTINIINTLKSSFENNLN